MPIYEYECDKCGNHVEIIQKFSDPPLETCEVCQGTLRKLISHSSFHLKGTGWYVTDYAKGKNRGGGSKSAGTDTGDSEKSMKKEATPSADKKTTAE